MIPPTHPNDPVCTVTPAYLREFPDVVEALDLGPQRVEDGHVVALGQQLLLQLLEDGDGVTKQHLKRRRRNIRWEKAFLRENKAFGFGDKEGVLV